MSSPVRHVQSEPRFTGLPEAARALQPRTVALRRRVHRHPEEGLRLPETQAAVLRALEGLPLEITTGTTTDSVVAVLRGGRPGPAVLLRGDMDALPLTEATGLEHASEVPGVMHACGHDTHVAMLASAARLLSTRRDVLAGSVVFMFQPGEEGFHGARHMIEEGVLEAAGTPVERAFALHITSTATSGAVRSRPGTIMASADTFRVDVTGRGGHGGMPHDAVDPVPAAAAMVGALQTMVARRVSVHRPAVVTVGRIEAGTTNNVIPETARLDGTIRTLAEETRTFVHRELRQVCEHVAAAHGCAAEVSIVPGYPVTVNDAEVGQHVLDLAASALGPRWAEPMGDPLMGAEDFSYVLQRVPGALAFLGACPRGVDLADAAPNHSNRVLFDEAAMEHGVALYSAFALDALR
ncbi:M20 metallopeptidase family protein [Umezawaea beigongshangensis]|uniref:M20 metallopeptidase family protein n=1 Tax=Umezawaea beigongshangensis TaxID=2780383 RepID=UPI0018F14822|nr:M20 family metallopeptidase [Umezawaea beigongshangensis]